MYKKGALDKLLVKKSSRASEQFKSRHARSKITIIIQRMVHFVYAKNLYPPNCLATAL